MMAPVMEKSIAKYKGKLDIKIIDIDLDQVSTAKWGVTSIPTLLFIKNGIEVERKVGMISSQDLANKINKIYQL